MVIETYRALALWRAAREEGRASGSDAELIEAIEAARRYAAAARDGGLSEPAPHASALVEAIAADDEQAVFTALIRDQAGQSRALWSLTLVERHLPTAIGPDAIPLLRELLGTLHQELSGASVLPR